MKYKYILTIMITVCSLQASNAVSVCANVFSDYMDQAREVVAVDFPGIEFASFQDPTESTGATLFFFPRGATVNFDSRGGSVASVETTLFEEGSYSNVIDAIVLSGGSTMGLAATDGVRQAIFESRAGAANAFDMIPSVPGAVVYDFGGRILEGQNELIYPDNSFGRELFRTKQARQFTVGRAGAGVTTSFAKSGNSYFGGQGISVVSRGTVKVLAAVVINAGGELFFPDGRRASDVFAAEGLVGLVEPVPNGPGRNTTLSIIATNVRLDRNSLKRLAVMVHTGMGANIRPFHGPTDGDILFTVSTRTMNPPAGEIAEVEMMLGEMGSQAMTQAIETAIRKANPIRN